MNKQMLSVLTVASNKVNSRRIPTILKLRIGGDWIVLILACEPVSRGLPTKLSLRRRGESIKTPRPKRGS
jgi:hypothetical protein